MKILIILSLLTFTQLTFGQIVNKKELIEKNKVKSSFKKDCYLNNDGSCSVIYEEYDKKGNTIEWNMIRLDNFSQYFYDDNNNKILTLFIYKSDTTHVDSTRYFYDHNNNLIREITNSDTTEYKNTYDKKGRLQKIVSESRNTEGNIVRETIKRTWTKFDKIKEETTKTKILEVNKKTTCKKNRITKVDNNYDERHNLTKTTYYQEDTISKTTYFNYDKKNRLIQQIEDDPFGANLVNSFGYKNLVLIKQFKTTIKYLDNGQIDELYTFFGDLCMGLNNHFLFKHYYLENGLINYANVFENDVLVFTIKYEYEFYE